MTAYGKPLPTVTALTQPFWEAARAGYLSVQRCRTCGMLRFPPSRACDACGSAALEWVPVSGRGTVWSACEFHQVYFKGFAEDLPNNVVLVTLEEGPQLYSNLLDVQFDDIKSGMAVEAVFEPVTDTVTLVKFKPAASCR